MVSIPKGSIGSGSSWAQGQGFFIEIYCLCIEPVLFTEQWINTQQTELQKTFNLHSTNDKGFHTLAYAMNAPSWQQ